MSDEFSKSVTEKIRWACDEEMQRALLDIVSVMDTLNRYGDQARDAGDKEREMAYRESGMQIRMSLGHSFNVKFV